MADYHSPTVVQPSIPLSDIMPIELLLLTNAFESEPDTDTIYLFASLHIDDALVFEIDEVRSALAGSTECRTAALIRERLDACATDDACFEFDAEAPWEAALQDIVRRSATLDHIEITSSYTCTRMRPDGFGGAVTIITADRVLFSSTYDMACELLDRAHYGELGCAPGFGSHVLLRLAEPDVRSAIGEMFANDAPFGLAPDEVTDPDVRTACLGVRAEIDLAHEERGAVLSAAMRALRLAADRKSGAH